MKVNTKIKMKTERARAMVIFRSVLGTTLSAVESTMYCVPVTKDAIQGRRSTGKMSIVLNNKTHTKIVKAKGATSRFLI